MRLNKYISLFLVLIMCIASITACEEKKTDTPITAEQNTEDLDLSTDAVPENNISRCEEILSKMTTEQKVAQKIMPTFRYYTNENGELEAVTEINYEISDILNRYSFGGIILFAQNISTAEQTVRLIDDFQKANAINDRPQLFIGVDQEGGSITRIDYGTSFCGNMALAATNDSENAFQCGKVIGSELKSLGFNVDFAPDVDVNNNPYNPVIGTRSFSDDPNIAGEYGAKLMQGLQSQNISAALKHFPGHGDTSTDSHTGLPCINKNYDELKSNELIPFQKCVDLGADMIMTAHIQFPLIETETYTSISSGEKITLPATLSKTIINDILRNDMGYDGVVITDAMLMEAIEENFDKMDSARLAYNAGVDILLMPVDTCSEQDFDVLSEYISNIVELVEKGTIPMENIDSSVLRILKLKEKRGLLDNYVNNDLLTQIENAKSHVGSRENRQTEWEITEKSITLVKNDNGALPIRSGKTVIVPAYSSETDIVEYALQKLKDDGKITDNQSVDIISRDTDIDQLKSEVNDADSVIIMSAVQFAEEMNPNSFYGADSELIDSLIEIAHNSGARVVIISYALPYDCARYQKADGILLAWSSKGGSEDSRIADGDLTSYAANIPCAVYLAFSDEESPVGKLPLDIPQLDSNYYYSEEILYQRGYGLTYK